MSIEFNNCNPIELEEISNIPNEIKTFWKQTNKVIGHYSQINGFIIVYNVNTTHGLLVPPVIGTDVLAVKKDEWSFYFDQKWLNKNDMLKTIKLLSFL